MYELTAGPESGAGAALHEQHKQLLRHPSDADAQERASGASAIHIRAMHTASTGAMLTYLLCLPCVLFALQWSLLCVVGRTAGILLRETDGKNISCIARAASTHVGNNIYDLRGYWHGFPPRQKVSQQRSFTVFVIFVVIDARVSLECASR